MSQTIPIVPVPPDDAPQRVVKVRRAYNSWVARETLEDYALRYTPQSFRRWSEFRIANTALGAVSFLALEAIGAAITPVGGVLIQYPLWLGKGGWLRVWDLSRQLDAALDKERDLKARNDKLASEVQDLKEGTGAVEERARNELGLIKENEIFVQVVDPAAQKSPVQPAPVGH